jgi:2-(1,2-epoxy-1,2-dihydrophenyl)acetyl-CoA isomerase
MSDYQTLEFSIDNYVAIIKLNRPAAANGISMLMAQELLQAATYCDENHAIRAVLLTGNGKMFSAGGDLKDFAAFGDNISGKIKELMVYLHASISRFARMDIPLVIAVNGMAAGAGFSLACIGDIVYAAQSSKFLMAYTAIGLSPDGGSSFFLPRLIGVRRTQELMLTNRTLTADEALEWGIVTKVIADEEMYAAALKTAQELAEGPTLAYAQVKKLLLSTAQESLETQMELEARGMGAMSNTADGKNGIQAFLAKQKPVFSGK